MARIKSYDRGARSIVNVAGGPALLQLRLTEGLVVGTTTVFLSGGAAESRVYFDRAWFPRGMSFVE